MLRIRADGAFKLIGLAVDPRAMLIGFAETGQQAHQICIEPEDGLFLPSDVENVLTRAQEIYGADSDDRHTIVTGEGQQERFEAGSLDKSRRIALEEALTKSGRESDRRYFVGRSQLVAAYRVYPVLSVLASRWNAVPTLPSYDATPMRISNSLPEELVYRLLDSAALSLAIGDDPSEMVSIGRDGAKDLVRVAASVFVDGVPTRMGGSPSELMESLDAIAVAPYEGRPATGHITFVPHQAPAELLLEFNSPVDLSRTRRARKILEMTGPDRYLASTGEHATGLIARPNAGDQTFEVAFAGRGVWVLSFNGVDFIHVDHGRAQLPAPPLSFELFDDNYQRLFATFPDSSAQAAWDLVQVASTQEHGTMLVIHSLAEQEAQRLGSQAVPITSTTLSTESLFAASRIDGAVLISPDAKCHAIGVILDGTAGTSGDPARGARFNSAARYGDAHRADCIILVVSEDGSIEIVPEPRRRVARSFIAQVVSDVVTAIDGEVDHEAFNRLVNRALAHSFYMTQAQCDELTAARQAVEAKRKGSLKMIVPTLIADPWMNDSYFVAK